MTDKEKAIVMAHTGICMLTGDKFQIFHKYVEDIMKRPIMTHEMGCLADEIKEKSKADFMALCANESSSENPNNSITKNDLEVECIDRAELLKAMDTWDKFGYTAQYVLERLDKDDKGFVPYVKYDDMVNCVKGMPSVTPQEPRWIPVSERLPEEYKRVLVFDSWSGVYVGQYVDAEEKWGGEHFINEAGMHSKTVVAWMPLPKPYEPQESEVKE